MLITVEHTEKVRTKRGRLDLTKGETAKRINVTPNTLKKIEVGDYDAPKAIFDRVMNFLLDSQKGRQAITMGDKIKTIRLNLGETIKEFGERFFTYKGRVLQNKQIEKKTKWKT